MRKFWAVVRHEYKKIVYKWTFLIGTLLFPVIGAGFTIVPALIFSIKGEAIRLVVVDPTGQLSQRIKENLSAERIAAKSVEAAREARRDLTTPQDGGLKKNAEGGASGFVFVDYDANGKSADQIRRELNGRAVEDEIDAYLILPQDLNAPDAKYEFRSRKAGDFVAGGLIEDAVTSAVRSQRLADANISEDAVKRLSGKINIETKAINEKGEEKDSDMLFAASFAIGLMIYITLAIYGQVIMGAVVEEKETRIAEILFSSARPFQLMMGKLVGVGLAGLTQMGIWIATLLALIAFLATQTDVSPMFAGLPHITPVMVAYFLIFFLLGFFIYASIFALIGSVVTTVQEGGQFAFPAIMLLLIGFYFSFAVIRDPNSDVSFWVSISPFFAPMTMPVRIMAETPPFWQIAIAFTSNAVVIAAIIWLASRVYRIGMLMYGKRASIPEIIKWVSQA